MAGSGSRFANAGFTTPKPFINMNGRMMIEHVLENFLTLKEAKFILIARKEHLNAAPECAKTLLQKYNVEFVTIDTLTQGPACTVFAARSLTNNSTPLIIANSDQIVDMNINDMVIDCLENKKLDGSILTFHGNGSKWSYAKINDEDLVTEVKEKVPISNHATVGIYFFTKGSYFFNATMDMISAHDTTNNEYYVAPSYNYMITDNKKVCIYEISENQMHGTGTPEDYYKYLEFLKNKP